MERELAQTLPPEFHTASTWYGPDMELRKSEWALQLSQSDVTELEAAADAVLASGQNIAELKPAGFPLPHLTSRLETLRKELIEGRGFALLRGLPVQRYDERKAGAIFYGLGCHLGSPRSQNAAGHMLGHVRDMGMKSTDANVRIYQTNERQTFHTDSCDVVGLLCLKKARKGGESLLVSATTIYNAMYTLRPDLLELLLQPIATDRRGEVPVGMAPYLLIPVFSYYNNYLTVFYQRQYIDSAQRFPDAPRLTPKHVEALDMFDRLANDSALNLSMQLEPGDMQFVYNHGLLHDRTSFEDWEAPADKRHLLRLWLSVQGDRPLPEAFAARFGSVEIGNRGGIIVSGTTPTIPWTA